MLPNSFTFSKLTLASTICLTACLGRVAFFSRNSDNVSLSWRKSFSLKPKRKRKPFKTKNIKNTIYKECNKILNSTKHFEIYISQHDNIYIYIYIYIYTVKPKIIQTFFIYFTSGCRTL